MFQTFEVIFSFPCHILSQSITLCHQSYDIEKWSNSLHFGLFPWSVFTLLKSQSPTVHIKHWLWSLPISSIPNPPPYLFNNVDICQFIGLGVEENAFLHKKWIEHLAIYWMFKIFFSFRFIFFYCMKSLHKWYKLGQGCPHLTILNIP